MITANDLISKFQYALSNKWGYIWGAAGGKWTQAQQDRATREQTVKYGQKWVGHNVADCSGMFTWAFKQLGGYMYHGSDTMFRKYCTAKGELKKGKRTDRGTLKPGTAVFVWNGKTYSHVGLYVGDNTVIEAMSTINGVTTSRVTAGKWTHWGELAGVDYVNTGNEQLSVKKRETIRKGSKGQIVKECQEILDRLGFDLGSWGVDGDFGKDTLAAVKAFQKEYGLETDGIVGPKTWEKLLQLADSCPERKEGRG